MLGVIGLFLPLLQGVLFLLIGLFILSTEYVWAQTIAVKDPEPLSRCRIAMGTGCEQGEQMGLQSWQSLSTDGTMSGGQTDKTIGERSGD